MVKCPECGFLASRNVQSRLLEETEQEIRLEGGSIIAWNTGKPVDPFEPPICFMRSPDYKAVPYTIENSLEPEKPARIVLAEIQRERTCKDFTPWQQGFTPKEHRDMLDREWMQKHQDEREEADRQFRLKMENDNRKWQAQQQTRLYLIAGIFTILGAIIGSLIVIFH